jgi:hypothetical protein
MPVPVLGGYRLARGRDVQVGQDERVGVDRPGAGQLRERQGALVGVQGAAPAGPRAGGDLGRVQRHPADQQPGVRGPPVRAVLCHGDLGAVHADRVVPVLFGDPGQQPPQRRDPLGADREANVRVVRGAGELPGDVAGVGARRHPARSPHRRGQGGQRAAQQIRRGRPRVIGAVAQVGGQHDLGLGPGRHVRPAYPLALVVIGHPALLAAVDLHVGGVQVDRDRPIGQCRRPFRGQQRQHTAGHRRQAGLYRLPLHRGDPPGQARRGRGRQPRHGRQLLARRIGALAVQPGQEVLPSQLRCGQPRQQLPGPEPAVALLDRADRRIQRPDHAEPVTQLGDGRQARVRRQRPIRRADPRLLPRSARPAAYPFHQVGASPPEMIITSQRSSSQVKGAPIGIYAAVSPTYSRIRV